MTTNLLGETFDVETDHGKQWLLNNTKGCLARWAFRMAEFVMNIKPKPGRLNANADAPSRNPVDEPDPNWSPEESGPDYTDIFLCNITSTEQQL